MLTVLTCFLLVLNTLVSSKPLEDDMLLFWRRSNGGSCSPFTTYSVECNKCVCAADGVPYCTKMICVKGEDKREQNGYSDEID